MPLPSIRLPAVLGTGLLLLVACRGRPDHPVLRTVRSAPASAPAAATPPEPGSPPQGMRARQLLFTGLADAETPLRYLKPRATGVGESPKLVLLPRMERAVLQRYGRGGPNGPVTNAAAFGFSAVFPLPPRATADLILDAAAEKASIEADTFATIGHEFGSETTMRRLFRIEMLNRGQGPARWDFKFTQRTERWDLPDGSIIMRHDPLSWPRPVHVSLYRGATWIEPHPSGSRVTEFLVMGTDIVVPFFLRSTLRNASIQLFGIRAVRLWEMAAGKRPRPR